jgi:hypothetical protein
LVSNPGLDDFQGHLATHGRHLFRHVNHTHAPFADLFPQLVGADHRAWALRKIHLIRGGFLYPELNHE